MFGIEEEKTPFEREEDVVGTLSSQNSGSRKNDDSISRSSSSSSLRTTVKPLTETYPDALSFTIHVRRAEQSVRTENNQHGRVGFCQTIGLLRC